MCSVSLQRVLLLLVLVMVRVFEIFLVHAYVLQDSSLAFVLSFDDLPAVKPEQRIGYVVIRSVNIPPHTPLG